MECQKCNVEPIVKFPKHLDLPDDTYLVRVYESIVQPIPEYDNILSELGSFNDEKDDFENIEEVTSKYGDKKLDEAMLYEQGVNTIGTKLVCRYCAGWSDEYE